MIRERPTVLRAAFADRPAHKHCANAYPAVQRRTVAAMSGRVVVAGRGLDPALLRSQAGRAQR